MKVQFNITPKRPAERLFEANNYSEYFGGQNTQLRIEPAQVPKRNVCNVTHTFLRTHPSVLY